MTEENTNPNDPRPLNEKAPAAMENGEGSIQNSIYDGKEHTAPHQNEEAPTEAVDETNVDGGVIPPQASLDAAHALAALHEKGLRVTPLKFGTKAPGDYKRGRWEHMENWTQHEATAEDIERWIAGKPKGLGVVLGECSRNLVAVDIDHDDIVETVLAVLPPSPCSKRGKKGLTAFYRKAGARSAAFTRPNPDDPKRTETLVDLLASGKFTVLPPSIHPETKKPYVWVGGSLHDIDVDALPELPDDYEERIARALKPFGYSRTKQAAGGSAKDNYNFAQPFAEMGFFGRVNAEALRNLDAWVPALFPDIAHKRRDGKGYRITSEDLGRKNDEDLSITPNGIKDFGVYDVGDPNEGKRSAIDLVREHHDDADKKDVVGAAHWLCEKLGLDPEELGWASSDEPSRDKSSGKLILPKDAPFKQAQEFIKTLYTSEGVITLVRRKEEYFRWTGSYYETVEGGIIRSQAWSFLNSSYVRAQDKETKKFKPVAFSPKQSNVSNLMDATAAHAQIHHAKEFPYWEGDELAPANEIVACRNGLLNVRNRELLPHTPLFHNAFSLPYDYQPEAGNEPKKWLEFLHQLFEDDQQSVDALHEIFGLMLVPDTSFQKIFFIIGPSRGGKGTIGRVLRGLIGANNIASPGLALLGSDFGMEGLINKPVALISDARLGTGYKHSSALMENLLRISGEDSVSVNRKNKTFWDGVLPTRLVMLANELPRLPDTAGAIVNRLYGIQLKETFKGREDPLLTSKLLPEIPQILNYALDGLDRLRKRGHFVPLKSAEETLEKFQEASDPLGTFIAHYCVVGPEERVKGDQLFEAYATWRQNQKSGRDYLSLDRARFGMDLKAAAPKVYTDRVREKGDRESYYVGISLTPAFYDEYKGAACSNYDFS